jgi:hypothetical protein
MFRTVLIAALVALPAVGQAMTPSAACAAPEHRQFDFWVGRWAVSPTGKPDVVAESLIEKLYAGCGVRENWMPKSGKDGGSLNSYVPAEKAWRQTWIDSSGSRADFKGGWDGKAMVLTGTWPAPDGRRRTVRMTYTPTGDGSVRQFGEASFDDGKTWAPDFDFIYRPIPKP